MSEQRVCILYDFHIRLQLIVVPDDADTSVDACLNLDRAEAEHGHSGAIGSVEALKPGKRLCHIFNDVNFVLF